VKAFRFGLLLTTVYALTGIFAGAVRAQAVVKGAHFTLPFDVNCGGHLLPAGDYTLFVTELDHSLDLVYRVSITGAGKTTAVASVRVLGPSVGERSSLVAELRGRSYIARELDLHSAGLVLRFREPKAKRELSANRQDPPQVVPILVAEK
jgi:hypothetical protein